jgi:hypothetical protein
LPLDSLPAKSPSTANKQLQSISPNPDNPSG